MLYVRCFWQMGETPVPLGDERRRKALPEEPAACPGGLLFCIFKPKHSPARSPRIRKGDGTARVCPLFWSGLLVYSELLSLFLLADSTFRVL